jgi:hypothetical protein
MRNFLYDFEDLANDVPKFTQSTPMSLALTVQNRT